MISGLWSNSNWDDEKQTRRRALLEIEESFKEAVINVYNKRVKEISFKDDPFFAAMKLPDID
jgi:hypothetical protein